MSSQEDLELIAMGDCGMTETEARQWVEQYMREQDQHERERHEARYE